MDTNPRSNPLMKLLRQFATLSRFIWARRAVNGLDDCDASEVGRVARELGISVVELRELARQDKTAADLLYRRLETLRLDPTSIDLAVMRDLQRCCTNCKSKQLCVHELEDKPKTASWPKYCPNESTIVALTTKPLLPR